MRDGQKTRFARRIRKTMTRAEVFLWAKLRRESFGWRFRRQHPAGPYVLDFACVECRLAVEVDGATHSTVEEIAHDQRRTEMLERSGWRVLRVSNAEVMDNMDGVLRAITNAAWEHDQYLRRQSP